MNIFEVFGLSKDYRKANKTTQLVKNWDEVVEKNKTGKVFSLQVKKDGVCAIVVILNGLATIWSRTGKRFTNTWALEHSITSMDFRDGAYFGEMVNKSVSLEVMSGIVNPNRTKDLNKEQQYIAIDLEMFFYDMVSTKAFIKGYDQTPFQTRHENLTDRYRKSSRSPWVHVLPTHEVESEELIRLWAGQQTERGEEGIVICDPSAGWEAGHKGYRKMKIVRGCDYDLLCIGWEEGKGKYKRKIANLLFKWKEGVVIKCMLGKGWSHELAASMYHCASHPNIDTPVGKIFQVYALEESSKGKLRLPKVGEERHDKSTSDV